LGFGSPKTRPIANASPNVRKICTYGQESSLRAADMMGVQKAEEFFSYCHTLHKAEVPR
jgi:hypothetical protein